jgi:hypothetical protein
LVGRRVYDDDGGTQETPQAAQDAAQEATGPGSERGQDQRQEEELEDDAEVQELSPIPGYPAGGCLQADGSVKPAATIEELDAAIKEHEL